MIERLITEVESVEEKNEEKINSEKHEICQLTSILKDKKQELEFLKNHGSNKLYSIQHHVDYRNNQSGHLCVFHSLFCFFLNKDHKLFP
jgi:predicted RNase H-like nuclease (RuvC/YqgF family)